CMSTYPVASGMSTIGPTLRASGAARSNRLKRARRAEWRHLISEGLFADALTRERMRADRFEDGFVLLLISLNSRAARKSAWASIVEALSQASLDTDVIGWFEKGSVLGLIRSVANGNPHEAATALADSLRHDLKRHITSDKADGCSIRLHVYSPQSGSTAYVFPDVVA